MSEKLSFSDFLALPPGELLLEWETSAYGELTADVFGADALQIGMPQLDTLSENRMQSHWLIESSEIFPAESERARRIVADPEALPVATESIGLVTLPHALDFAGNPQQTLREAVRVLEPEGRLVLTAFNPLGLWWLRQQSVKWGAKPYLPSRLSPIPLSRLKDWLTLLGLEIDRGRFGIYAPGLRSMKRLRSWGWLDKAGDRWMPQFSNLMLLSAVKRTRGARIVNCASLRRLSEVPAGVSAASTSTTLKTNEE